MGIFETLYPYSEKGRETVFIHKGDRIYQVNIMQAIPLCAESAEELISVRKGAENGKPALDLDKDYLLVTNPWGNYQILEEGEGTCSCEKNILTEGNHDNHPAC